MKKLLTLCLAVLMILPLVSLAACSSGFDYQNEDLTPFVTLPTNYKTAPLSYKIKDLEATITDEKVYEDFEKLLDSIGAYYQKLTTGDIFYGDRIGLLYKGVLRSTIPAIKDMTEESEVSTYLSNLSEEEVKALVGFEGGSLLEEDKITHDTELVIGSGQFIAGFEDAIIDQGVKLGDKNVPLLLKFPKNYDKTDLADKDVVFFVSPVYKWQTVGAKELVKGLANGSVSGSRLSVSYQAVAVRNAADRVTDPEAEGYMTEEAYKALFDRMCDAFEDGTWDLDIEKKPVRDEDGKIVYKTVSEVVTITESSEWLVQLMLDFNEKVKNNQDPFTRYEFEVTRNVKWTDETETGAVPVEKQLVVRYTVDVHTIPEIKVIPANGGIVDGTAAEHQISYTDFANRIKEKNADMAIDTTAYPTFAKYFEYVKTQTQFQRNIQIRANQYHGVYAAVTKAATIDYKHETVAKLIQDYIDEVNNNVDYWYTNMQVQGYESIYNQIALQSGYTSAKEYYMYMTYGATSKTLATVAKTKITEKLVFWQLVKTENVTLTDSEYQIGLANLKLQWKQMGQEINWDEVAEADIREALLWDKVAQTFIDNGWVTFTTDAKN